MHSNDFNGNVFIYDTKNGKKTTLTFEHYRTWEYGDFFMFTDVVKGEGFDGSSSSIYTELSPRFSLSKILGSELFKNTYIPSQINLGKNFQAYLYGVGIDVVVSGFNVFSINTYHKTDNINDADTYQITTVYASKSFSKFHIEGFIDITRRDINTQHQLLYNLDSKKKLFTGIEWLYYKYKYKSSRSKTSVVQAMIKYKF